MKETSLLRTTLIGSESFKPSISFLSESQQSATESARLRSVEAVLQRKVFHHEVKSDSKMYEKAQALLVTAFSKTIARNLRTSIENNEKEFQKLMAKQLIKKAQFGANF